jgi:hypothetical protein
VPAHAPVPCPLPPDNGPHAPPCPGRPPVQTNSTLMVLSLMGNPGLRDSGISALCEALATNVAVCTLSLTNTGMGPVGCAALSRCLKVNTTLQELSIASNIIGDEGGEWTGEGAGAGVGVGGGGWD